MEFSGGKRDVVDPEVRAYVNSLVTALGGSGADEDGRYVLGDDALACLRDLKKWLKLYDEKANRLDVARCLAESNLVGGDLLQILAAWPENATDDRLKSKLALACLELLVPLTWPLEKNKEMTVNHHRHIPYLEIAQVGYKRSILGFDGARILHTAVRCALPAMAEDIGDRSTRDQGIIKLLLYFLRNIAMIAAPPNGQYEGDEAEISRSATIDAFDYQDIFHFLLTVSSTMGEDFNTQDVVVMDVIFHLIKGVDVEKLFFSEKAMDNSKTDELIRLRKKEQAMLRSYQTNAPTRHNRFGTMAWMQRDDAKMTTISGQAALRTGRGGLDKMDSTKKFKPPRRAVKGESGPLAFDNPVPLNASATKNLRAFVEEFLDSGFNPLFTHIRKAIDREAERVLDYHQRQFFYLISWFLEAERVRRKNKKPSKAKVPEEADSFALVASVLNQEMFITLNRAMDFNFENKNWYDLSAGMKCFTQILLTVQEMADSRLEDDQEIAENILARIFYEDTTHDRVAMITRTYKDQGFGYLDSCTELTHNYMRILEQYSKQNVDMQVRSRRRTRTKKKAARDAGEDQGDDNIVDESEGDDEARAQKESSERRFDYKRFAAKFLSQGCIDTLVSFTKFYLDLRPAQLKRAHRFFYRVAFKQDMSVMLFRVDIIHLFYTMIKGPGGLDPQSPCYKEWDEMVKQLLKKCTRKIQERPELVVEMLFSKTNSTAHFIEYGYVRQTIATKPKAAAELEVKGGLEWEHQIGVAVGALLDRNEADHIEWVKSQLSFAESERRSWEAANQALQSVEKDPFAEDEETPAAEGGPPKAPTILLNPDNDDRKTAMFKNGYLRLLMKLAGLTHSGAADDPDTSWIVPSEKSADQIKEALDLIKKFEFAPPTFDDDKGALDQVRRVSAGMNRKRAVFDDESDDGIDDDEEELLFEPGGPTAMKKSDALRALKKNRRRRRNEGSEEPESRGLTNEQIEARAAARRARELEKNRKIKSELYVRDSDDDDEENDRIFFEAEERLRQENKIHIMKELLGVGQQRENGKKRMAGALDGEGEEESDEDVIVTASKKRASSAISLDSDEEIEVAGADDSDTEEEEAQETDTSISSPRRSAQPKRRKVSSEDGDEPLKKKAMEIDDEDEENIVPVANPRRPRVRAGFIMDSSDDE
ncbi:c956b7c0-815c-419c-9b0c-ca0deb2e19bc [Sclerotinia trifoliorum]|uniref:Topoisomerase 1-associated factor 1 n=1 Tax=Sclerotinia trifoliorum TaxID=28548 RepID=A0A8H2VMB4_9HELO|nr:c956b7c0-815c-419c-9b0c-ca0deb2e19bc [Sclerotinia trifoliorum]